MFGVLNVNKPPGITSRDVVNHVQRRVRPLKVGHAGTLDPLATGVLVVCVGQATRLIEYVQRMPKRYVGEFLLGRRSETEDIEGEVELLPDPQIPNREDIARVLPDFLGKISQRPPAHSAVKIDGKRAYELARAGKEVNVKERDVEIHALRVLEFAYPRLVLDVTCGSGTYIRSLGRDIAEALQTGAVMSKLERTAIGEFHVDTSVTLADMPNRDAIGQRLLPPQTAVTSLPVVTLPEGDIAEIAHGRFVRFPDAPNEAAELAGVDGSGRLVAVLVRHQGDAYRPALNFVGL